MDSDVKDNSLDLKPFTLVVDMTRSKATLLCIIISQFKLIALALSPQ